MFRRAAGSSEDIETALRNHSTSQLLRRARTCLDPRRGEAGLEEAARIIREVLDRHRGGRRHSSKERGSDTDERVVEAPFGDRPRHRD